MGGGGGGWISSSNLTYDFTVNPGEKSTFFTAPPPSPRLRRQLETANLGGFLLSQCVSGPGSLAADDPGPWARATLKAPSHGEKSWEQLSRLGFATPQFRRTRLLLCLTIIGALDCCAQGRSSFAGEAEDALCTRSEGAKLLGSWAARRKFAGNSSSPFRTTPKFRPGFQLNLRAKEGSGWGDPKRGQMPEAQLEPLDLGGGGGGVFFGPSSPTSPCGEGAEAPVGPER